MSSYCKSVENKHMKKLFLFSFAVIALFGITNAKTFEKFLPSAEEQKTTVQTVDWSVVEIDRVEVYKSKRLLQVLDDGKVIKIYKMRLGFAPTGHKTTEGDGKTPEGKYVLDWRNPNSQFYKSLHISYPNAHDLAQAKMRGVSAGGDVMIHGSAKNLGGSAGQPLYGYMPKADWTWGCIAVSNQDMDELWQNVKDGTEIEIFP